MGRVIKRSRCRIKELFKGEVTLERPRHYAKEAQGWEGVDESTLQAARSECGYLSSSVGYGCVHPLDQPRMTCAGYSYL